MESTHPKARPAAGHSILCRAAICSLLLSVLACGCKEPAGNDTPVAPVRLPAEFEPIESVLLRWRFGEVNAFHLDLVENTILAGAVPLILVQEAAEIDAISAFLRENGVPPEPARFLTVPTDSIWVRDYAPFTVAEGSAEKLGLVDFRYSYRDQLADDNVGMGVAAKLGMRLYEATGAANEVVLDGGDLLTDGFGTAFCSYKVVADNAPSESELAARLNRFLGITRNIVLESLPSGANNHVDMVLKLLDEETLLLGEYKTPGPARDALERLRDFLAPIPSCYGRPFRIFRIPMPGNGGEGDFRTYLNALILNDRILVPAYGVEEDFEAMDAYAAVAPGYTIIPLDCSGLIQQRGAIHCVTREFPQAPSIRIAHPRILEPVRAGNHIQIRASCFSKFPVEAVFLHVRMPGKAVFERIRMAAAGEGVYSATLSLESEGELRYRISAHGNGVAGHKPSNGNAGGYISLDIHNVRPK